MHSLKEDGSLCCSRHPSLGRRFFLARQVQRRWILFYSPSDHAFLSSTQSHRKTPKREQKYAN